MASNKRAATSLTASKKPAKRSKDVHEPTKADLAIKEARKEKARDAARKKAAQKRQVEDEKNHMLDALVKEMGIEPGAGKSYKKKDKAAAAAGQTAPAAQPAPAQQQDAQKDAPSSPIPSQAALTSPTKPEAASSIDDGLPVPTAEPSAADGASTGTLVFSTTAKVDVQHKRGRKVFKKSAEEATRQRGLTVVASEWLPDRAGIQVKWSRPAAEPSDGESSEYASESESTAPAPAKDAPAVVQGATSDAAGPHESDCVEIDDDDDDDDDAAHETSADMPQWTTDDRDMADASRDADPGLSFHPTDFDDIFEREDAAPDSDKAWGDVVAAVSVLQAILRLPLGEDERKAQVLDQLHSILTVVNDIHVEPVVATAVVADVSDDE